MIRPEPARWLEILVARADVLPVLEQVARSHCVQFDVPRTVRDIPEAAEMSAVLSDYRALAAQYHAFLPKARLAPAPREASAPVLLTDAFARLRDWASESNRPVARVEAIESELKIHGLWRHVLGHLGQQGIPLGAFLSGNADREAVLFALPRNTELAVPETLVTSRWAVEAEDYLWCAGAAAPIREFANTVVAIKGRRIDIPEWLLPWGEDALAAIDEKSDELQREATQLKASIRDGAAAKRIDEALGDIARGAWYLRCLGALEGDGVICRLRGWTDDRARLELALDHCDARALIHFPAPARWAVPPLILRNPPWARPFEFFTRLLGMPAQNAADPSALLVVIAPLIFGYMFGDVCQGLLLVVAGILIGKRWESARTLVAGGLVASVFGLVFGSVFSVHDLIEPLWLQPLQDPLAVLMVPLAGGAVLIVFGTLIAALEAHWSGTFRQWLTKDGCALLVYLGAGLAIVHPAGYALVAAGAVASVAGHAIEHRSLRAGFTSLGELIEKSLQLMINNVSFVRVGAFALAHAGLSSAVMSMTAAMENVVAQLLVLALGNALIIVLEVMAVSIQTTRLVLFEFFVRFFFDARGREFHPATPPSIFFEENPHEAKP